MTGPANGPTGGWIKLWRRYTSADHPHHPINTGEPMSKWGAWIDLLGQAQWSDDGDLEAGQLQASRSYLQRRWHWTDKAVRVYLSNLEDEGQIETHHPGGRAPSIITVCNWHEYQGYDAKQGADQHSYAPSWQGPEKGAAKRPANGPGKGQPTPWNDGERSRSGASKRPAKGPAQGPENGPEVKKYKKGEEQQTECAASQGDPALGRSAPANGTDPSPEQPSLLEVPESDPEPTAIDREARRWHETAKGFITEHRGARAARQVKLDTHRESGVTELIEDPHITHRDWELAWIGALTSDYWDGKGSGRVFDYVVGRNKKGRRNILSARDDGREHLKSQKQSRSDRGSLDNKALLQQHHATLQAKIEAAEQEAATSS